MAARVTKEDRAKHSAVGGGRFPVATKQQAISALKLRGKSRSKEERRKIIRAAMKFVPAMAHKAWLEDKKAGLI